MFEKLLIVLRLKKAYNKSLTLQQNMQLLYQVGYKENFNRKTTLIDFIPSAGN